MRARNTVEHSKLFLIETEEKVTFHRRCNLSATEQEFQEHIEWLTKKWRTRFTCLTLRITVYKANIQEMSGCCRVLMEKLGVMLREKNPHSLINQTMR